MITIVIPVFNAFDDAVRCVESVRRHSGTDCRILVIDDASTDTRIQQWTEELRHENDARLHLVKNQENIGFVHTVNRGMALSGHDVVLLNSDTIVSSRWLEKMSRCAQTNENIGTVTPFSNNAEICSFPLFCENNPLDAVDIEAVNRALESVNAPIYPDLPTAVGFCMYIRRELIDKIGVFDADTFGPGYGEENDFCMRAVSAGYRNVLCDDTYVAHVGSRSFSDKTDALKTRNSQRLFARYPDYLDLVQRFIADDPIAPIRVRAVAELHRRQQQSGWRAKVVKVFSRFKGA